MTEIKPLESRSGAQTLERGLDLIERVVDAPMTIRELAASSGLAVNTARRIAGSLVATGFLTLGQNGQYRAGPKLLELGARGREQLSIVDVARSPLKNLSTATGAPSFLGERHQDYSVHLHRAPGSQRVMVSTPVGTRRKLPETSLGKALLLDDPEAEWERLFAEVAPEFRPEGWREAMRQARTAGVVVHDSPSPDRIRAVAASVRDASGEIVAAISIVSPMQYADDAEVARIVPLVRDAAAAISHALGYHGRWRSGRKEAAERGFEAERGTSC